MTYRDLLVMIQKFTPEQLDCDVTVKQDYAEYIPAYALRIVGEDEVLLDYSEYGSHVLYGGQPVLICNY